MKFITIVVFFMLVCVVNAQKTKGNLLILYADDGGFNIHLEFASTMMATGLFNSVDTFDVKERTPTIDDLKVHDCLYLYVDGQPDDGAALSLVLKLYIDQGFGGLTVATFALSHANFIEGQGIAQLGYLPVIPTGDVTNEYGNCGNDPGSFSLIPGIGVSQSLSVGVDFSFEVWCNERYPTFDTRNGARIFYYTADTNYPVVVSNSRNDVVFLNIWPGVITNIASVTESESDRQNIARFIANMCSFSNGDDVNTSSEECICDNYVVRDDCNGVTVGTAGLCLTLAMEPNIQNPCTQPVVNPDTTCEEEGLDIGNGVILG